MKIGMIGASGHFGQALRVIAEREGVQFAVFAMAHPFESPERVRRFAACTDETHAASSPEALLESFELDAIIINPPYGLHARYATMAARLGLPIYCEKPLATTLEDLRTLEAALEETSAPIVGMFESRAHPVTATAKRLVAEGAIGRPLIAYGQKTYKLGRRPPWFNEPSLYGGTIPWVAIHAIDWTRFITGLEYTAVTASHVRGTAPELPNVETAGTIHFEWEQGGAVLSFDYHRPAAAPTHGDDRFRIVGTEGELWGSLDQERLELLGAGGPRNVPLDQTPSLFERFLDAVAGRAPMPMTSQDALRSTEAALWAREAAERKERLLIPDTP